MSDSQRHTPLPDMAAPAEKPRAAFSVFAWPAWLRVLVLMPLLALLWAGVFWALPGAAP